LYRKNPVKERNQLRHINIRQKPVANEKESTMQKWECPCGYIYDPESGDPDNGVAPGTAWENVPRSWVCPLCGAEKEFFYQAD
jgi:rubredoxin